MLIFCQLLHSLHHVFISVSIPCLSCCDASSSFCRSSNSFRCFSSFMASSFARKSSCLIFFSERVNELLRRCLLLFLTQLLVAASFCLIVFLLAAIQAHHPSRHRSFLSSSAVSTKCFYASSAVKHHKEG